MRPVWLETNRSIISKVDCEPLDPGVGRNRYGAAHEALERSDQDLGLVSFTFDPNDAGSIVLIPETLIPEIPSPKTRADSRREHHYSNNPFRVVDDGIAKWREGFTEMTTAIVSGQVEKVVLARQITIEAEGDIDIRSLALNLESQNPDCFVFEIGGLVGASPELLVSLENGRLTTNVLAGTGQTESELENQKTFDEHRLAVESAIEALTPHLRQWESSSGNIRRQGPILHAATSITGETKPGTTVLDVLADLHPTAAVGGTPTAEAVDLIKRHEAPRGRYGGPIGWFNREGEGVFAIALRCALVRGSRATLYAGGGLVQGSERETELAETDLKLRPMFEALRSDRASS